MEVGPQLKFKVWSITRLLGLRWVQFKRENFTKSFLLSKESKFRELQKNLTFSEMYTRFLKAPN